MHDSTVENIIDAEAFFSCVHPEIVRFTAEFAAGVSSVRAGSELQSSVSAVLTSAGRLLDCAYAVFDEHPRVDPDITVQGLTSAIEGFTGFLAKQKDPVSASSLKSLLIHFEYYRAHDPDQTSGTLKPPSYALDFLVNSIAAISNTLFSQYRWKSEDPRRATRFFDTTAAEQSASAGDRALIQRLPGELTGWCSNDKAFLLYSLVRETKPKIAVEVGVHAGRSLVPIALALRENGLGTVIAVDTWSAAASTKYRTNPGNDFSWSLVDYAAIKRDFLRYILDKDLIEFVNIVQASSDQACMLLDEVDFLHIDGGHSSFGAVQDVANYLPKLRRGGVVVFDDIDWSTTGPAVEVLLDTCKLLHVVESFGNTGVPGCAAFVKL